MAVIIMPSTASLISSLRNDYPQFSFQESDILAWSNSDNTIYYNATVPDYLVLHELAHAILGHSNYRRDIELLAMEREAWHTSKSLAATYGVNLDDDIVQSNLDTYRDWLHSRSTCPKCCTTGLQTGPNTYSCPECRHNWRVNEARTCALRRYIK